MTGARWRRAMESDLGSLFAISKTVHPAFPEPLAIFEERLSLCPEGMWALESSRGLEGYLVSHPWHADSAPPLGHRLGSLPEHPGTWYLHDLALLPLARGSGAAQTMVDRLAAEAAAAGFPSLSLVAVNNSLPFWSKQGFRVKDVPGLDEALASYEEAARFMVRAL